MIKFAAKYAKKKVRETKENEEQRKSVSLSGGLFARRRKETCKNARRMQEGCKRFFDSLQEDN